MGEQENANAREGQEQSGVEKKFSSAECVIAARESAMAKQLLPLPPDQRGREPGVLGHSNTQSQEMLCSTSLQNALYDFIAKVFVAHRFTPTLVAMCDRGDVELLQIVDQFDKHFGCALELLGQEQLMGMLGSREARAAGAIAFEALVRRVAARAFKTERAP